MTVITPSGRSTRRRSRSPRTASIYVAQHLRLPARPAYSPFTAPVDSDHLAAAATCYVQRAPQLHRAAHDRRRERHHHRRRHHDAAGRRHARPDRQQLRPRQPPVSPTQTARADAMRQRQRNGTGSQHATCGSTPRSWRSSTRSSSTTTTAASRSATLTVNGAISQKFRGAVGTFGGDGTGYIKDYNYDDRLRYISPPHFLDPVESAWHIQRETLDYPLEPCPGQGFAAPASNDARMAAIAVALVRARRRDRQLRDRRRPPAAARRVVRRRALALPGLRRHRSPPATTSRSSPGCCCAAAAATAASRSRPATR